MFKTKAFDAHVKAIADGTTKTESGLEDGDFQAVVAVFNNLDSYGEVIRPGAFAEDLKAWEAREESIPVIWSHDWGDPFSHIGTVKAAAETEQGLLVTGHISPEERDANPKAAQIWRLLKARRVTQFSFAFDVIEGGECKVDGELAYELRRLKIHEVGPCLLGVNQETELLAMKAASLDPKDLGAASKSSLLKAYQTLARLLDITPGDDDEISPPEPVGSEQEEQGAANPDAGPASHPGHTPPAATIRQRLDIELELAGEEPTTEEENLHDCD